jgi:hypothetical protein
MAGPDIVGGGDAFLSGPRRKVVGVTRLLGRFQSLGMTTMRAGAGSQRPDDHATVDVPDGHGVATVVFVFHTHQPGLVGWRFLVRTRRVSPRQRCVNVVTDAPDSVPSRLIIAKGCGIENDVEDITCRHPDGRDRSAMPLYRLCS